MWSKYEYPSAYAVMLAVHSLMVGYIFRSTVKHIDLARPGSIEDQNTANLCFEAEDLLNVVMFERKRTS